MRTRTIVTVLLSSLLGLISLGTAQTGGASSQTGGMGEQAVGLELVAEGLTAPVAIVPAPGNNGELLIVDQIGVIRAVDANGQMLEEPFLDIRDRVIELDESYDERGLLGLAFHPNYANNGRFFVYYSAPLQEGAPEGWSSTSRVSSFQAANNQADPNSEEILLRVNQPQLNHNAGQIAFGPDGYLYVPLGDGGGANDEDMGHIADWYEKNDGGNGQDLTTNLLGTILRIDVDNRADGQAYAVPEDNPFVGQAGAEEVWAYGLRNPWRISFDTDGTLYAADLGQELFEEVNVIEKGGNYGWNVKEATHCFSTQTPEEPPQTCPDSGPDGEPLIDPVLEHDHDVGIAIIGGYVYRGSDLPFLRGSIRLRRPRDERGASRRPLRGDPYLGRRAVVVRACDGGGSGRKHATGALAVIWAGRGRRDVHSHEGDRRTDRKYRQGV